jgi:uncharacterized SAM-binding protein YcdF (DUF218 family)/glycosyltransferase involved in cell wall biosynthesis
MAGDRPMNDPSILQGHDIVCFSSIDWQFIWQGHQEIMTTLAANGNRVLFVENTGVRAPSLKDLPRLTQRVRNWWAGTKGFRCERENLFIFSPILLPFPYSAVVRRINRSLLTRTLNRWMRATGFGRAIVWTFLPTPLVRDVIRDLDPAIAVYYCIDDFSSSSPGARRISRSEEQLCRQADLVFVTSEKLRQKAAQFNPRVTLFPFGVSYPKFEQVRLAPDPLPGDLATLPRPIVGYVGGIHQWIDMKLLTDVARRMPDVTFVLVGPLQMEVNTAGVPNLHLLGGKPHDDVPRYIKGFDVGIVPYLLTDYTANVYPTKLNEYLAMGIPVVATDLPEIRRFNLEHGPRVGVAGDAAGFESELRKALQPVSEDERQARIRIARENSWHSRIARMSVLIDEALEARRQRRDPWEAKLEYLYRRARSRAASVVVAVALSYFLLFHTSLPWLLASPLRVSETPRAADAIVVLAGGVGESGQAGGGYQERVQTAASLYQRGFAPRMIFESGYAFAFKEAEIMRDLAMSIGVPSSAIILETTGVNTYDDVVKVREVLARNRWRRILLVSSPYHMRRATLVWRRLAPDVEVVPTPVPQSQFYSHERGASLDQLRGLVREYAALSWYWWKGWV